MAKVGGIFALTLLELDQHKMDPSISYRTFGSNNGIIISWDIAQKFTLAMEIWFSLRLQRWQERPRELIVDAALVSEGSVVNCYCTSRQLTPDWFRHQRNPTDKESCKKDFDKMSENKLANSKDALPCGETYGLQ